MKQLKQHKGQATVELIPGLITFSLMLTVVAGLSVYLYLQNVVITVAREGVRFASLNPELGTSSTQSVGEAAVKGKILDMLENAMGQRPASNVVTITAPTGNFGERLVRVKLNLSVPNPITIPDFEKNYTGKANSRLMANIPLVAEASAHYEE